MQVAESSRDSAHQPTGSQTAPGRSPLSPDKDGAMLTVRVGFLGLGQDRFQTPELQSTRTKSGVTLPETQLC